MTGVNLLIAGGLLLANAFFVAVEFALLASRRTKLEAMAARGSAAARVALGELSNLNRQLAGAQLGITLASLLLGFVAEPTVAGLIEGAIERLVDLPDGVLHAIGFSTALLIVVFLHMVVGEMIPKNVAIAEPDRTALWLAVPMRWFTVLFRPVIRVLNVLANGGQRLLGVEPTDELVSFATGDELAGMLAASRDEGLLDEVEHRLMTGALGFPRRDVTSVMVGRDEVVAVPIDTPVADVELVAAGHGHSRLPVYGRDLDELLGYVHAKDLLALPVAARTEALPAAIVRQMLTVTVDRSLMDLLLAMRRTRLHFAVVVGADDRVVGIATLEDVLESLVGDIRDESDVPAE